MAYVLRFRGHTRAYHWHYDNSAWVIPERSLDQLDDTSFEIPAHLRPTPATLADAGSGQMPSCFFRYGFDDGRRFYFEGDNLIGISRCAEDVEIEVSELAARAWQRGQEIIFAPSQPRLASVLAQKRLGRKPRFDKQWAIERAKELLRENPSLSQKSVAAQLASEHPKNPNTMKEFHQSGIRKVIQHLWGGRKE